MSKTTKNTFNCLLWCVNEHLDFRIPELLSIASQQNLKLDWIEPPTEAPYMLIRLKNEEQAKKLASKCMLVRSAYQILGLGNTNEQLHNSIQTTYSEEVSSSFDPSKFFKISIKAFNRTLTLADKAKRIKDFDYLPVKGKVNLSSPDITLQLIEYYGLTPNTTTGPHKTLEDKVHGLYGFGCRQQLFFGRWIGDGNRDVINQFSLKSRLFIGSTSMDPLLSFIMTNMAQIKAGDIVLDPFVGTGSILVSAAHRGAYVWGWDIDYMTLHGRTKPTRCGQTKRKPDENVLKNFKDYNLEKQYLDISVMDSAYCLFNPKPMVDAIITDPPYGIRESLEKVKSVGKEGRKATTKTTLELHYPMKTDYCNIDLYKDLLNFAAKTLVMGGRLVFWIPIFRQEYTEKQIPQHPCLKLEANSEQVMNAHSSRRLITMTKFKSWQEEDYATCETVVDLEEFRKKFFRASRELTRKDREEKKQFYKTDKRGQALNHRLAENASDNNYSGMNTFNNVAPDSTKISTHLNQFVKE